MEDGNEASVVEVRFEGPLRLGALVLPPSFTRRTVTITPGHRLAPGTSSWRGEIVSVEQGDIDVQIEGGHRLTFRTGAVLWLDGLGHAVIRCAGDTPAVLVAIGRRDPESGSAPLR